MTMIYESCVLTQTTAKSGLNLKLRAGLPQLLQEVASGNADYQPIPVYDVSRWGRFQDADESAHCESLCKLAGSPVHYCAEVFANDGTIASFILRAIKRTTPGSLLTLPGAALPLLPQYSALALVLFALPQFRRVDEIVWA